MMDKKLDEFKSSIIRELTETMTVLILVQTYKNQLEEIVSTVVMLHQHLTILMQENLNLQEKARKDRQDLEKCCEENEQHGRRLSLRIRNTRNKKMNSPAKSWK